MDAVKEYKAALATGHLSPEESVLLCREGRDRGVRMILTHPEFSRTRIPVDIQKELSLKGVLIEKCWYNIGENECSAAQMADNIRTVGAGSCYMTTDRGQGNRESPVEAMQRFIGVMMENGISENEIMFMTRIVPKSIVA